jgi:hypothetical protein
MATSMFKMVSKKVIDIGYNLTIQAIAPNKYMEDILMTGLSISGLGGFFKEILLDAASIIFNSIYNQLENEVENELGF